MVLEKQHIRVFWFLHTCTHHSSPNTHKTYQQLEEQHIRLSSGLYTHVHITPSPNTHKTYEHRNVKVVGDKFGIILSLVRWGWSSEVDSAQPRWGPGLNSQYNSTRKSNQNPKPNPRLGLLWWHRESKAWAADQKVTAMVGVQREAMVMWVHEEGTKGNMQAITTTYFPETLLLKF